MTYVSVANEEGGEPQIVVLACIARTSLPRLSNGDKLVTSPLLDCGGYIVLDSAQLMPGFSSFHRVLFSASAFVVACASGSEQPPSPPTLRPPCIQYFVFLSPLYLSIYLQLRFYVYLDKSISFCWTQVSRKVIHLKQ